MIVEADGHAIDATAFRKASITWGQEHFRSFPWRLTEDPYHILIAEVMLHRTQAPQVMPTYEQFIARYPAVPALARATKEELHDALYSLGLRWRIDLIHEMAVQIMQRFDGRVPGEKADLLSLPGVSEYITSAVRCFAWNLPEPLIDTNTVRVVGRLFGLQTPGQLHRTFSILVFFSLRANRQSLRAQGNRNLGRAIGKAWSRYAAGFRYGRPTQSKRLLDRRACIGNGTNIGRVSMSRRQAPDRVVPFVSTRWDSEP